MRNYLILSVLLFLLVGCSLFEPLDGESPVKSEFSSLSSDPRVLYKEDAVEYAKLVAKELDESIKLVEKTHGESFSKNVFVHVCDTPDCFSNYTGKHPLIAAAVSEYGLFLSPRAFSENQHQLYLAHELSHLHLFQQISILRALYIPQWFHDGVATFASNGGGGHLVSKAQVLESIKANKNVVPIDSAGLFGKGGTFSNRWPLNYKASKDNKLQQHMNYRQSAMFVAFLSTEGRIHKVLRYIESGKSFKKAFHAVYHGSPSDLWSEYRASIIP